MNAIQGENYGQRLYTRIQHKVNILAESIPQYRTPVQITKELFAGKGLVGGGQSTQTGITDWTSAGPKTENTGGGSKGCSTVWYRAVVARREEMVQGLSKASQ